MTPLKVGLIGCGRISDIYLQTCQRYAELDIVACASLDLNESRAKAAQYGIARSCQPDDIFADPSIDCVLNLTIPAVHAAISRQALESGKHVYSEKPFVTELGEGREILELAAQKGLLVGNAPDTFFGARWQTARKLIDSGVIGKPTGVFAFVGTHGVERHHPNPDFYYLDGGGPLWDLGPYYLTAMVFLLGPLKQVCGMAKRTFNERMIESQPRAGEMMPVEVDTHVQSMLAFESGVIGSMTMSFDVWDSETPRFEVYGENGTLCIPDPDPVHGANIFEGEVWYRTRETCRWAYQPRKTGKEHWQIAENTHAINENSRGVGLLDLAHAIREKRQPRASGALALHVVEAMEGILESSEQGCFKQMQTNCPVPELLAENFGINTRGLS